MVSLKPNCSKIREERKIEWLGAANSLADRRIFKFLISTGGGYAYAGNGKVVLRRDKLLLNWEQKGLLENRMFITSDEFCFNFYRSYRVAVLMHSVYYKVVNKTGNVNFKNIKQK